MSLAETLQAPNITITYGNAVAKIAVDGDASDVEARVAKELTYYPEGYRFTTAYKLRQWDGRKTLWRARDRTFPAGLAQHIEHVLSKAGYRVRLISQRSVPMKEFPCHPVPAYTLQPHQQRAVAAIMHSGRGIIEHAVGAGKSIIMTEAIRRLGVRSLVIVQRKENLTQLLDTLRTNLKPLPHGTDPAATVGVLGDGVWEPGTVTVATIQTITRHLSATGRHGGIELEALAKRKRMLELLASFAAIHVDEAHHLPANSYAVLMANTPNAFYRIGYSATPMRSGSKEQRLLVEGLCGPVIHSHSPADNVEAGRAVPVDVYILEGCDPPPLEKGERYPIELVRGIVQNDERNEKVTRLGLAMGKRGPTLILTERLEHGKILAAMLEEAGCQEII